VQFEKSPVRNNHYFYVSFHAGLCANDSRLSYDTAKEVMLKNSRAVAKQKLSERKAFYQYNGVVQRTGN